VREEKKKGSGCGRAKKLYEKKKAHGMLPPLESSTQRGKDPRRPWENKYEMCRKKKREILVTRNMTCGKKSFSRSHD